jgi:Mn2+/Fe2+ NRAMP family transporter
LLLNLLTIITEFIGVALALGYFGISRYVSVPIAALTLIVVTGSGSFRRWERAMYLFVAVSFVVIPVAALAQSHHAVAASAPSVAGPSGSDGSELLFVIALIGTTVAPWQLFFQQSNVVDKRISARWLPYERIDTLIGTVLFTVIAVAVLVTCALAFDGTPLHAGFVDAGQVVTGLAHQLGPWGGALFAIALLNGSVLGAAAVTLSTSYAIGDVYGVKHSLHRRRRDAPVFHGSFVVVIVIAAVVVMIPGAPLGVVTVGVQALAGVLLPSATVFLLLLSNDATVLGPWTNPRWLNIVASLVVGGMIVLSALLTVTTLFPRLDVGVVAAALVTVFAMVVAAVAVTTRTREPRAAFAGSAWERATWTTPPLETLLPPRRSKARTLGLSVLRVYLTIVAFLAVTKVIRLMLG